MCLFQTRTYAQLLRMRACCKFFKQEGQKVRKSIKLTIKTDILIAQLNTIYHKIPKVFSFKITKFLMFLTVLSQNS